MMPVHLLGNPCDMRALGDLARRHRLHIVEDTCEAHGAHFGGRPVGTFGVMGTFSFYFSHHISTIEGGVVVTNDDLVADRQPHAACARLDARRQEEARRPEPWHRRALLFVNLGYNFRATEVQGAFGIHQVPKLEGFIRQRRENVEDLNAALRKYSEWLLECPGRDGDGSRSVWFGYPITVKPTRRSAATTWCGSSSRAASRRGRSWPATSRISRPSSCSPIASPAPCPTPRSSCASRSSSGITTPWARGERRYVKECVDEFMSRWT